MIAANILNEFIFYRRRKFASRVYYPCDNPWVEARPSMGYNMCRRVSIGPTVRPRSVHQGKLASLVPYRNHIESSVQGGC